LLTTILQPRVNGKFADEAEEVVNTAKSLRRKIGIERAIPCGFAESVLVRVAVSLQDGECVYMNCHYYL